jgi:hypothetical protein
METFDVVLMLYGEHDRVSIEGYHLEEPFLEVTAMQMHRDWAGISRLADALARRGTIAGRESFDLLTSGQQPR